MGNLRAWWQKLTGKADAAAVPAPNRARSSAPPPDGLQLVDEPERTESGRAGAAGVDPYSSDAGYAKPHSWERVDHD
jgi:hypothetical protein